MDKNDDAFELQQHVFGYHTIQTGKCSCSDNSTDEAVLHYISPELVELGANIKREISEITNPSNDEITARKTFVSHARHLKASAEMIYELWCIGIKRSQSTLGANTKRGIRSAILPLERRYRSDRVLSIRRLNVRFATYTLFSDVKSLNQNTCAQVFSHKVGFNATYQMVSSTGESLGYLYRDFRHDFGIPEHLTFDGYSAQVGQNTLFMKTVRKYDTQYHISSPSRPNENPAEGSISELKKIWYRIMLKNEAPERLWDYGLLWISETGNLSVLSSHYASGRTPL